MNFQGVVRRLHECGWTIKDQKGGHVHFVHGSRSGKITIPKHGKGDLKPGTLNAIWKQAGQKK